AGLRREPTRCDVLRLSRPMLCLSRVSLFPERCSWLRKSARIVGGSGMSGSLVRRSIMMTAVVCAASALCAQVLSNAALPERNAEHPEDTPVLSSDSQIAVPGPLRSLERMAGISQKVEPEEVLPLVARN